jgi:hypothetical protein
VVPGRVKVAALVLLGAVAVPAQVYGLWALLDRQRGEAGSASQVGAEASSSATVPSPPPGVPDYWQMSAPKGAGFSIWAPGPMARREFDDGITIHRLQLGGTISYVVDRFEWYGISDEDTYLLGEMIRRSERYYDAEIVERQDAPLDGHPGALLRLQSEDRAMLVRMVSADGHFYTVTAPFGRCAASATKETARVFIDSFELHPT